MITSFQICYTGIVTIVLMLGSISGSAQENRDFGIARLKLFDAGYSSNQCGLYSMYCANCVLGDPVDPAVIFSGDYISSSKGSTVADLIRLAGKIDLESAHVRGLDLHSLVSPKCPILLQFHVPKLDSQFHWVVALGADSQNEIQIYDPVNGVETLSAEELSTLWTGNGLMIWNKRSDAPSPFLLMLTARMRALIWAIPPIFGALLIVFFSKYKNPIRSYLSGFGTTLPVALIVSGVAIWSTAVLMASPIRLSHIGTMHLLDCWGKSHRTNYTREIALESLVIDCRTTSDYRLGHIPGALSLPISSGFRQTKEFVLNLPSDRSIVVYCQSVECGWAAEFSKRLSCFGIDAKVYVGGYQRFVSNPTSVQRGLIKIKSENQ